MKKGLSPLVLLTLGFDFLSVVKEPLDIFNKIFSGIFRGGNIFCGAKTVTMENLKLKNVEHESEFFFPILDGELQYHGYMYELSL